MGNLVEIPVARANSHFRERILQRKKALALVLVLALLLSLNLYLLFFRKSPVLSASAVQVGANIGVYWDVGCAQQVSSINWSSLTPGQTEGIAVYVRNEGNDSYTLDLATQNWQPADAPTWLSFLWSCINATIVPGQVVKVTPSVHVAASVPSGVSSFSFDIVFQAKPHLLGDINNDGVVSIRDFVIITKAYGSMPGDPNWNAAADLNKDGVVNLLDLVLLSNDWGPTGTG